MSTFVQHRRNFLKTSSLVMISGAFASCGDISNVWRFFTPSEIHTLSALCNQIVPTDDYPGAVEAGVLTYIDRKIVGFYKNQQDKYRQGLHGLNESSLALHQQLFADLLFEQQMELLKKLEQGNLSGETWEDVSQQDFFNTVIDHTMQGYYGDSRHGGNKNHISWQMIGVPHPPIRARRPEVNPTKMEGEA